MEVWANLLYAGFCTGNREGALCLYLRMWHYRSKSQHHLTYCSKKAEEKVAEDSWLRRILKTSGSHRLKEHDYVIASWFLSCCCCCCCCFLIIWHSASWWEKGLWLRLRNARYTICHLTLWWPLFVWGMPQNFCLAIRATDHAGLGIADSKGETVSLSGGGGLEDFFSADYFISVDVKDGIFFHTPSKARFCFTKNGMSGFFLIVMLGRQLFLPLCRFDRLFSFFATYQSKKKFSTYNLGQIIFFSQKQRQIIFSKTLPTPPPPG